MNDEERDAYRPACQRRGQPIVDIVWFDTTVFGGPPESTPGGMRCSTDGCYGPDGSRDTSPLEPGGLTMADRVWVDHHLWLAKEAT